MGIKEGPSSKPIGRVELKKHAAPDSDSGVRTKPDHELSSEGQNGFSDPTPETVAKEFEERAQEVRRRATSSTRLSLTSLMAERPNLLPRKEDLRAFRDMARAATTHEAQKSFLTQFKAWLEHLETLTPLLILFDGRTVTHHEETWTITGCREEDFHLPAPLLTLVQHKDTSRERRKKVSLIEIFAGIELGRR